jgi:hypothetical protein
MQLSKKIPLRPDLRIFLPSKLAAAIIFKARLDSSLKHVWPVELITITNATKEEIEPILKAMSNA